MSGTEDMEAAGVLFRYQWTKMPKAPITALATFDTHRFKEDNNMGLSGYFIHDRTGPTMTNGIAVNYAYSIEFSGYRRESHYLSFGVQAALNQFRLDGSELIVNDVNDPLVVGDRSSSFLPDLGVGIYYHNPYIGIGFSVPQILGLTGNFKDEVAVSPINRERHFYANIYGKIPLGQYEDSYLMPSIWGKYAFHAPFHFDFNLRLLFDERFIVGVGYNTANMVSGELGMEINTQYRFGYSYSTQFTEWNTFLGDSHEIHLTYILDSGKQSWY